MKRLDETQSVLRLFVGKQAMQLSLYYYIEIRSKEINEIALPKEADIWHSTGFAEIEQNN